MSSNPYSPPQAGLQEPAQAAQTVQTFLAKPENRVLGRRFVATWIDFIVCASFLLIPDLVLGEAMYQSTIWLWLALLVAYFPLMEGQTGYSVGKFICRIRVVDEAGNVPGFKKAIVRTLLRLVEVNPFLMGGVPAGLAANFSKYGQRLGDMAAGTYVMDSSAAAALKS
jgi:uncharacterized RDD family membrane protein YckC